MKLFNNMILLGQVHFDFSTISGDNLIIAAIGYFIVFSALVLLFFVFNNIPKIINIKIRQKLRREGKKEADDTDLHVTGEENAAISAALYLYFNELHDEESNVITIKKVSRIYSPWSSKIYGLNTYKR